MNVHLDIPRKLFNLRNSDIAREVLEAIAAEGFRSDQLSTAQVRRLLGFETRFEVHQFLAKRGIPWVKYSIEEAERESKALRELLGR